jgi:hypothetical protein
MTMEAATSKPPDPQHHDMAHSGCEKRGHGTQSQFILLRGENHELVLASDNVTLILINVTSSEASDSSNHYFIPPSKLQAILVDHIRVVSSRSASLRTCSRSRRARSSGDMAGITSTGGGEGLRRGVCGRFVNEERRTLVLILVMRPNPAIKDCAAAGANHVRTVVTTKHIAVSSAVNELTRSKMPSTIHISVILHEAMKKKYAAPNIHLRGFIVSFSSQWTFIHSSLILGLTTIGKRAEISNC